MEQKHKGVLHCNLSKIMGERKVKMTELVERSNTNRNTSTNIYYERNLENIKLESFMRICDGLNIPLSELLEYDPSDRKE